MDWVDANQLGRRNDHSRRAESRGHRPPESHGSGGRQSRHGWKEAVRDLLKKYREKRK